MVLICGNLLKSNKEYYLVYEVKCGIWGEPDVVEK